MPEHLEGEQAVPGGQGDQLGAGLVPARGQTRPVEALHEHSVEGERQQRGIVEATGEPLRPPGGLGPALRTVASRLQGDRGQQPRPRRLVPAGRESGQGAFGRREHPRGLLRVVDTGPDRGDVVGADHAGGQFRVAQLLGRRDGRHTVSAGRFQTAASGHREIAQQAHRRLQPRPRAGRHGAV
ncbi:hypothetical protein, partial [Streptosporangium carneum]|uniref:hypothetical protein n=1 Tax=Streptosporangium carneum TaxID=47481 RepID=UPI0031E9107B